MRSGNDVQEFEELFNTFWNRVYQLCLRYSQDEDAAKDLTQNIFSSVWQRNVQFDDYEHAEKYLSKAAKYQCVHYWRTRKDVATIPVPEQETESTEQQFLYTELLQQTRLAIDRIPEPSRSIFLLSRENEYTYQEIAHERNISPKTVEFHISKALRLLREKLLN